MMIVFSSFSLPRSFLSCQESLTQIYTQNLFTITLRIKETVHTPLNQRYTIHNKHQLRMENEKQSNDKNGFENNFEQIRCLNDFSKDFEQFADERFGFGFLSFVSVGTGLRFKF